MRTKTRDHSLNLGKSLVTGLLARQAPQPDGDHDRPLARLTVYRQTLRPLPGGRPVRHRARSPHRSARSIMPTTFPTNEPHAGQPRSGTSPDGFALLEPFGTGGSGWSYGKDADRLRTCSAADQHLALQRDALTKVGCEKLFTDKASGAKANRPQLADPLTFGGPATRSTYIDGTKTAELCRRHGISSATCLSLEDHVRRHGCVRRKATEGTRG